MNSPDYTSKPASEHTRAFNGAAATPLDPEDFTRAQRGFIASLEDTKITDAQGRQAGDIGRYDFLQGDAPDTVHPNLWRHAKLNVNHRRRVASSWLRHFKYHIHQEQHRLDRC